MRKKLAVASFAAFLAAVSLTACSGSKDAQTTAAQTEVQTEAAETEAQGEKTETEASAADRAYEGTTLNVMLAYGCGDKYVEIVVLSGGQLSFLKKQFAVEAAK